MLQRCRTRLQQDAHIDGGARTLAHTMTQYVALQLERESRDALLRAYPPTHVRLYAHHVTLAFGVGANALAQPASNGSAGGVDGGNGHATHPAKTGRGAAIRS